MNLLLSSRNTDAGAIVAERTQIPAQAFPLAHMDNRLARWPVRIAIPTQNALIFRLPTALGMHPQCFTTREF